MSIINPLKYTEATLSLFKKVPQLDSSVKLGESLLTNTIDYGYTFTDRAKLNSYVGTQELDEFIKSKYSTNIANINQGFYKSFKTVTGLDYKTILVDQLINYFSTYGLESLGIDTAGHSYVPSSVFNLPEDTEPLTLLVIDLITTEELRSRLEELISTRAALDLATIKDIITLISNNSDFDFSQDIDSLHNKELRIALYALYKKAPSNPIDFLRYMVFLKTGNPLLIKNNKTCDAIKRSEVSTEQYFKNANLKRLAEVFYRFKPLWLSFKAESTTMKSIINQIRRLADTYHKPSRYKILDHITSVKDIDLSAFNKELDNVSVFKKVSLLNAILYRTGKPESITYYIRNGLAYADTYQERDYNFNPVIFNTLFNSIVSTVARNVRGKTIYLPDTIQYAVPTSTKLFWNNIPYGSSMSLGKDVVVGVHWTNVKYIVNNCEQRIDLDLHINSREYNVGWHSRFSLANEDLRKSKQIVFTGDMTDAPISKGGATEAYYINNSINSSKLMINLNYYNYDPKLPVNFEMILDTADPNRVSAEYLFKAHKELFVLPGVIDKASEFIGVLDCNEDGNKTFYFTSSSLCKKNVSVYNQVVEKAIQSACSSCTSCLKLQSILKLAGATVVDHIEEDQVIDIDLSPANVTKDVFLSLFAE